MTETFASGPESGVPAGYATCPAGTVLLRGHSPEYAPEWYSPAVGERGRNRYDLPERITPADPGVCYLAPTLEGVLLEVVIRDRRRSFLSRRDLRRDYNVATAITTRELILVDLMLTPTTIWGYEVSEITQPWPYFSTQQIAGRLLRHPHPIGADGILYSSRFAPRIECVALWSRSAEALSWEETAPMGADDLALVLACMRLGIDLID